MSATYCLSGLTTCLQRECVLCTTLSHSSYGQCVQGLQVASSIINAELATTFPLRIIAARSPTQSKAGCTYKGQTCACTFALDGLSPLPWKINTKPSPLIQTLRQRYYKPLLQQLARQKYSRATQAIYMTKTAAFTIKRKSYSASFLFLLCQWYKSGDVDRTHLLLFNQHTISVQVSNSTFSNHLCRSTIAALESEKLFQNYYASWSLKHVPKKIGTLLQHKLQCFDVRCTPIWTNGTVEFFLRAVLFVGIIHTRSADQTCSSRAPWKSPSRKYWVHTTLQDISTSNRLP